MSATYTPISQEDFIAWATGRWKDAYTLTKPSNGREDVLVKKVNLKNTKALLEFRIYTSVEQGVTRESGTDAIRTVLYDVRASRPLGKESRINRVEGATTVFERLDAKLKDMAGTIPSLQFCNSCGAHLVERVNRRTEQHFMGCSAYPKCGNTSYQVDRYGLKDLPKELQNTIRTVAQRAEEKTAMPTMQSMNKFSEPKDETNYTELVPENQLIPTSTVEYPKFKFPFFNPIQSKLVQEGWHQSDCNLVCGTATSTGKSTIAELCMAKALQDGKKVIYTSPLKALTMEKYTDWKETFSDHSIIVLTGDFKLTPAKTIELNKADIVCMTSEMLDVRVKNHKSEKSEWLHDVGVVVIDESHLLNSIDRGHSLEVGLMKFARLVPTSRILVLSATMPNVEDFQTWLTAINQKETHILNSDWRPIPLEWNFPIFNSSGKYAEQQASKRDIALDQVIESREKGRNIIVFCHDKMNGNTLMRMFESQQIEAHFHNADLKLDKRMEIEEWFRSTPGSVLIATSTLAYGLNTPCMDVVVLGTTRGMNNVDDLDIIQEGGRAGRTKLPKYEYTIETKEDFDTWKELPQNLKTGIHFVFEYNEKD